MESKPEDYEEVDTTTETERDNPIEDEFQFKLTPSYSQYLEEMKTLEDLPIIALEGTQYSHELPSNLEILNPQLGDDIISSNSASVQFVNSVAQNSVIPNHQLFDAVVNDDDADEPPVDSVNESSLVSLSISDETIELPID